MHAPAWLGILVLALCAVLWLGFKLVSGVVHLLVIVGLVLLVRGLVTKGARSVSHRA